MLRTWSLRSWCPTSIALTSSWAETLRIQDMRLSCKLEAPALLLTKRICGLDCSFKCAGLPKDSTC
jgi:hypothetical protein